MFEYGWEEGDEGGEEDAYGASAGEEEEFASPAFGGGSFFGWGVVLGMVVVGVAVAHVHGECRF